MSTDQNDQLVLICGTSASGKSASLRNIRNQDRWLYMNTEAGKRLPFKNKFRSARVDDPYQVLEAFDYAIAHPDDVDGIIVDSLTFLMEMYERSMCLLLQMECVHGQNSNNSSRSLCKIRLSSLVSQLSSQLIHLRFLTNLQVSLRSLSPSRVH